MRGAPAGRRGRWCFPVRADTLTESCGPFRAARIEARARVRGAYAGDRRPRVRGRDRMSLPPATAAAHAHDRMPKAE
jgi:hypothetical protein